MTKKHNILLVISTFLIAANCLAVEQFKIPDEQAKVLVGSWKLVKIMQGEEVREVPAEQAMIFTFKADGSGNQQKGERDIPIIWGANNQGMIAVQWKQEDGNGDGMLGTWEKTDQGIKLTVREYEDGKNREEDESVLFLRRE